MSRVAKFQCRKCRTVQFRYCNCRKCTECGGEIQRLKRWLVIECPHCRQEFPEWLSRSIARKVKAL